MTELYLIAHVVRGEPAFDIAIQIEGSGTESDPGPWWIIPTSGHRARPYWYRHLANIGYNEPNKEGWSNICDVYLDRIPEPPPNWPDHYPINKPTTPSKPEINLEELGL